MRRSLRCRSSNDRVNFSRQLFLSAVSSEFRRCREMLRADLTGPDMPWKVAEQADFAVGGGTLLEKLDRYIRESSAVIHLIGEAGGALAKPLEVDAFLKARPAFLERHGALRGGLGDLHSLSYTQWEAFMALEHDVPVYLFIPSADFKDRQPGFSATRVDGRDLVVLALAWNSCSPQPAYNALADLDPVSTPPGACVDAADFHLFMNSFGQSCP